jgi:hypothetical protein
MTSEELANEVTGVINNLRSRIVGIGKDQYDMGDKQKIELKSEEQVINETIEEIDDALVYLAHLRSRISHLQESVERLINEQPN